MQSLVETGPSDVPKQNVAEAVIRDDMIITVFVLNVQ